MKQVCCGGMPKDGEHRAPAMPVPVVEQWFEAAWEGEVPMKVVKYT